MYGIRCGITKKGVKTLDAESPVLTLDLHDLLSPTMTSSESEPDPLSLLLTSAATDLRGTVGTGEGMAGKVGREGIAGGCIAPAVGVLDS